MFSAHGLAVDLAAGTAKGDGTDTLNAIEMAEGSEFDDILRGDDGHNGLWGCYGDDTLIGRGGNDYLDGMNGYDSGSGGPGTDRCLNSEHRSGCETARQ